MHDNKEVVYLFLMNHVVLPSVEMVPKITAKTRDFEYLAVLLSVNPM